MTYRRIPHAPITAIVAIVLALSAASARAELVQIDQAGNQNVQNLKQLALAMQNFEAVNNTLPGQYLQNAASPTLSWRVAILPYLGYGELYSQFDLTKSWDDPANLRLLPDMPPVFRSPADSDGSTTTRYEVGTGSNLIFNGPTGTKINSISDGTSNTILIGEAAAGVPWTKPQDLPIGPNPTLADSGFSSITPGYVPFAFADGSVRFVSQNVGSSTLLRLFQANDGGTIDSSATHDYVVVPEPAGLTLLGLGIFALLRRQKRSHRGRTISPIE